MDEKTAMNVEFLRARLLSERIVSRNARQRSENLAKRVMELEEQLRIVNIQRKKAEKAAEEVLSILETQGITCSHGITDSSTEEDDNPHKDDNGNQCLSSKDIKEDEFLTPPKLDKNKVNDEFSCSDIDAPRPVYNCLSWKSNDNSLDSQEKQKTKHNRRRHDNDIISTMKPSQRLLVRSCRKTKRHNVGSTSENELEKSPIIDAPGNGVVFHPRDFGENCECLLEASESKKDDFSLDLPTSFSVNRSRKSKDGEKDDGMERALEQQKRLIFQFQSMENAQRVWEEKFHETGIALQENLNSENPLNTAENGSWSAENFSLAGWIPRHEKEVKSSPKDISSTEDIPTERCRNCETVNKRIAAPEKAAIEANEPVTLPSQESRDFARKLRSNQKSPTGSDQQYGTAPIDDARHATPSTVMLRNSMAVAPEARILLHTSLADQTNGRRSNKELPTGCSLGSVLQSLERAKLSLKQELVRIPAPAYASMKPDPSLKALDFPVSSSALFRLPADQFSRMRHSRPNVYGSGLRLSATRPDLGFETSTLSGGTSPGSNAGQFRKENANYYAMESDAHMDRLSSSSISASTVNDYPLYNAGSSAKRVFLRNEDLSPFPELKSGMPFGGGRFFPS